MPKLDRYCGCCSPICRSIEIGVDPSALILNRREGERKQRMKEDEDVWKPSGVLATVFKCGLAVLGSVLILVDHAQMPESNALYSWRRRLCGRRDLV